MSTHRSASFRLSAFGDEIAADLAEQLSLLRKLGVGGLELRGVWGKNVLHLDDEEVSRVKEICTEHQMEVSAIGSPIGKSPLADPVEKEVENLQRICQIAHTVGTRRIRIFSFYPPDTSTNAHYDQHLDQTIAHLASLAALAAAEDVDLLLENEKGIVGDTPQRCRALLAGVDSPHLRFAWDPANFIQVDVEHPTETGWPLLNEFIGYVHIKDALRADGSVRAAGEGDGQVGALLAKLKEHGYQGYLVLEPHLATAGHSSGFSGVSGMTYAVETLRALMNEVGCIEQRPVWAGER